MGRSLIGPNRQEKIMLPIRATFIIFVLLVSLSAGTARAIEAPDIQAGGPIVRCQPTIIEQQSGTDVQIDIYIENVTDLYGVDIKLAFDPTQLQVIDADANTTNGIQITPLSGFLAPNFVLRKIANNTAGTIQYANTQVNPTPAATGSGAVAQIRFHALATGTAVLHFTQYQLSAPRGVPISGTAIDCQVSFLGPINAQMIKSAGQETLTWNWSGTGIQNFEIWQSTTNPYFSVGDTGSTRVGVVPPPSGGVQASLVIPASDFDRRFYLIRAIYASGTASAPSNRVGIFSYPLVH